MFFLPLAPWCCLFLHVPPPPTGGGGVRMSCNLWLYFLCLAKVTHKWIHFFCIHESGVGVNMLLCYLMEAWHLWGGVGKGYLLGKAAFLATVWLLSLGLAAVFRSGVCVCNSWGLQQTVGWQQGRCSGGGDSVTNAKLEPRQM